MWIRSAISIRAKQPYVDWLLQFPELDLEGLTLDEINESPNLYLVQCYDYVSERETILESYFLEIFERELLGWCPIRRYWPAERTLELFRRWFVVTFHGTIEDICSVFMESPSQIGRVDSSPIAETLDGHV